MWLRRRRLRGGGRSRRPLHEQRAFPLSGREARGSLQLVGRLGVPAEPHQGVGADSPEQVVPGEPRVAREGVERIERRLRAVRV